MTPETTIYNASLNAQTTHCAEAHGNVLTIQLGCATCLALHVLVQQATPHPFETVRTNSPGEHRSPSAPDPSETA
jgi:hypothetical protein